jgi:hypothetical protein
LTFGLLARFLVRSHDFPCERLGTHGGLAKGVNLFALLVELSNHLALVCRRLLQQLLERRSLFAAFMNILLVRRIALLKVGGEAIAVGRRLLKLLPQGVDLLSLLLLFREHGAAALFGERSLEERLSYRLLELRLKPLGFTLVSRLVVVEFGDEASAFGLQPIPLGCRLVHAASKIQQMCSSLSEQLLELLLRGEAALQTAELAGRVLEFSLETEYLLAEIAGVGAGGGFGGRLTAHSRP